MPTGPGRILDWSVTEADLRLAGEEVVGLIAVLKAHPAKAKDLLAALFPTRH